MNKYGKFLPLGLVVLLLISCGLFTPPQMPAEEGGIPTIAEGSGATVTPTLVPPATDSPTTEAVVPTEALDLPTATPWPSIQLKKDVVVAIPAGYTLPGDSSMCASMDEATCKGTYDDDGKTTVVWHFKTAGFARLDFGDGWAEHIEDPNQFVEAQRTDGCGDGCTTVDLKYYPDDLGEFGVVASGILPLPESSPTAFPQATNAPAIGGGGSSAWLLPSWQPNAMVNIGGEGDSLMVTEVGVQEAMLPENLPLVPAEDLIYQAPPLNCADSGVGTDSCTTRRLQAIRFENVPINSMELLRMTGDAITIRDAATDVVLAQRPSGDEKHDLWLVLNLSNHDVMVDIIALYGSDRSWYTAADGAWTPELADQLLRQALQDFNLQTREESDFAATPVPNCENSLGCTYNNVRVVIILDDSIIRMTGKWYESQEPHWVPSPVQ